MSQLFSNPYLYLVIGVLIVFRNAFGAFPEPDPNRPAGFGSCSPGYKFLYRFARAMTLDLTSVGVDAKGMVASKLQQTFPPPLDVKKDG